MDGKLNGGTPEISRCHQSYTPTPEITQELILGPFVRDFSALGVYSYISSMNSSRDSLSETLRSWRVTPPAEPNFRQGVWQRIGKQTGVSWPTYLRAHLAAWCVAAAVAMGVAAFTGNAVARTQARTDRNALVVTYLTDLDPRVQAVLKQ